MWQEIPELDPKGLREFGWVTGALFVILFGLLLPWLSRHSLPHWPWIVAGILWLLASLTPASLRPIYKIWMYIGGILGWVNSRVILSIIFYGMVSPMGFLMRLLGKDPLHRNLDPKAFSYRQTSTIKTLESMEKPY
jgi:hypothetical protein